MADPLEQAEEALAQVAEGFKSVKLKVGRPGNVDVEAVRLVRERVGPSINIKVDANGAWPTPKAAIKVIRKMEEFDLQLVEQPIAGWNLEGMADIRSSISAPLLADESIHTFRDALRVARFKAADVLNVYVSEAGGLVGASKAFAIGEAAGLPCLIGSQCELGIGTAAGAHLGVAMPNLAFESDLVGVLRYPEDVVNEQIRIEQGVLYPPEGSGLGVSLDWAQVEKWRMD
jgi:muconate cycloisomerase